MRYLHAGQLSVTWVIGEMVQGAVDQIPAAEFGSEATKAGKTRQRAKKCKIPVLVSFGALALYPSLWYAVLVAIVDRVAENYGDPYFRLD